MGKSIFRQILVILSYYKWLNLICLEKASPGYNYGYRTASKGTSHLTIWHLTSLAMLMKDVKDVKDWQEIKAVRLYFGRRQNWKFHLCWYFKTHLIMGQSSKICCCFCFSGFLLWFQSPCNITHRYSSNPLASGWCKTMDKSRKRQAADYCLTMAEQTWLQCDVSDFNKINWMA